MLDDIYGRFDQVAFFIMADCGTRVGRELEYTISLYDATLSETLACFFTLFMRIAGYASLYCFTDDTLGSGHLEVDGRKRAIILRVGAVVLSVRSNT